MENKKRRIAEIKEDLADPNTPATLKKMLKEELAELEGSKKPSSKKSPAKKEVDPEIKAEAKRIFQEYLDKGGYEKIAKENALPLFPQLEKGIKPEKVVMEHFEKHLDCLDYDSLADRVEFWQKAEDVTCENWEEFFSPKERKELMSIWKAEIKKLVVPKSKKTAPAKKQTPDRSDRSILKKKAKKDLGLDPMAIFNTKTRELVSRGLMPHEALHLMYDKNWSKNKDLTEILDVSEKDLEIKNQKAYVKKDVKVKKILNYGDWGYEFEPIVWKPEEKEKPKKKRTAIPAKSPKKTAKKTTKKSAGAKKKASVKKKVAKSKLTPEEKKKVQAIKKDPKYKKLLKGVSDEEILADMKRKAKKAGKRPQKKGSKHKFYYEHRRTKTDEDLRKKI
jgi:hypothetical protein